MAIDKKHLKEIVNKLNPGETLYLVDRLDNKDSKTVTAEDVKFDQEVKKEANWGELIKAIYSNNSSFSSGEWATAPSKKKGVFTVINTKKEKTPAFDVNVELKNNTLIITNLKDKSKKTMIELAEMVSANKETETDKPFYETLMERLKKRKPNSPKEVMEILDNIQKMK